MYITIIIIIIIISGARESAQKNKPIKTFYLSEKRKIEQKPSKLIN